MRARAEVRTDADAAEYEARAGGLVDQYASFAPLRDTSINGQLTLGENIADLAGLPKANLHYYFPTKEALYRRVVSNIFEIWLEAAGDMEEAAGPAEGLGSYIDAKMDLARSHPAGSKVWAAEVMHGAPVIQDYLEQTLRSWTNDRATVIQRWIDQGRMGDVSPRHLLYMIWATTQHYADFAHQIETLNDDAPLDDAQWAEAKDAVRGIILRGVGAI